MIPSRANPICHAAHKSLIPSEINTHHPTGFGWGDSNDLIDNQALGRYALKERAPARSPAEGKEPVSAGAPKKRHRGRPSLFPDVESDAQVLNLGVGDRVELADRSGEDQGLGAEFRDLQAVESVDQGV